MQPVIDLFLLLAFYVKYLRNYFNGISTPTCVTTSARTNTALSTVSRVSLIFWKQCMSIEINTILEDGKVVDLVYLDFQKACDKVPHERLLLKLRAHGITGQCNNIIRNFITGRTMAVRVGDELCTWEPLLFEVPQGSVLGPLLLLLFINNMPAITTNISTLFADDSKLIENAGSPATIQSDLHCLSQWADVWQMKFNESKCSVSHIGKDNPKNSYMMGIHPYKWLKRKEIWEWLFQLVIPFVGRNKYEK